MKKLGVLIIFWLLAGMFFVVGAFAIAIFTGRTGLFIGAFIGGPVGAYVAYKLVVKWHLLLASKQALIGALAGTFAAYAAAATHLDSPLVCLLSPLLVGIGALIGEATRDHS